MKSKESKAPLLLLEILRGYSKITYKNEIYYFRHFRIYESLELAEFELDAFNSAIKRGIKSEEQLIELAIKRGIWTEQEESSIKSLKWMITKSEKAGTKITDNIARKAFDNSVQQQRDELNELESRRASLIAHSAERLAERKRLYKEASQNIFKDAEMKEVLHQDDIFEVFPLISEKINELGDLDILLHAAYSPSFFDTYCLMYRQPHEIFKADIFNMTIWQKRLLFYSSVLLNKLKNYDVPDDIREDAVKLYSFSPKKETSGDNQVTHGVADLRQKMAEKGGKLTAEDF